MTPIDDEPAEANLVICEANGLPYGTVRRSPVAAFAHAILCWQETATPWQCVDLYSALEMLTDEAVRDWPIVDIPASDSVWERIAPGTPEAQRPA
ncbi:hypothetical protein [Amycolatopsis sp. NPDC021455]|uniref:hypothetical protein n=1 Tax=Amycolatopsis sp. NPDC021455 TaxID=3154901 RepID=UPI0033EF6AF0